MSGKPGFFAELKRRNVLRAAVLYIAAVWALAQGISQLSPSFNLPEYITRWFVIVCAIAFPFWLAFAWLYEITPHGIKRESEVVPGESITHSTARKLDFAIIGVLAVAVALLAWQLLVARRAEAPTLAAAATAKPASAAHAPTAPATANASQSAVPVAFIPAQSIAVLPFENLNVDKKDAYFVAGIQDLILTKLADVGDLKVIARTSTAMYQSHPGNLTQIGEQLGVATILEGSVQQAGYQVLINVQLINVKTDSHIWAQSYTRTLTNVFGVEGDVATRIATALNAKLSSAEAASLAAVPTTNRAAYNLFLRAEYETNQGDINYTVLGGLSGYRTAIPLYRQAIEKDPGFALAYARLSYTESNLAWIGGEDTESLNRAARADAEQAQKLAPGAAASQLALGYCDYYGKHDYPAALKAFAVVLKLRPNDSQAQAAQGFVERHMGRFETAIASLEKAFALDPRNGSLADEIGNTYMMISRYPDAENWFQRALAINPDNLGAKYGNAVATLLGSGDVARALKATQGDEHTLQFFRASLMNAQRHYAQALPLLDAIPDTPDNFPLDAGQSKAEDEADVYQWLMHDPAKARPLYEKALAELRAQLVKSEKAQSRAVANVWQGIADAELGLGQTRQGLAAIAQARAAAADPNTAYSPSARATLMELNASLYAEAGRANLAVPLLEKAFAMPGIGEYYAPVMLWLDPAWDPIRHDPRFQGLLKKYAKYKPAVIYPIPSASSSAAAN